MAGISPNKSCVSSPNPSLYNLHQSVAAQTLISSPGYIRVSSSCRIVLLFKHCKMEYSSHLKTLLLLHPSLSPSLSLFSFGHSKCLLPCRSEGYPSYGFQPMGSAPAADTAPTFLDAPRPPLHPGPPPLHQPIAWTFQSLGRFGNQSAGSEPSRQPQGKKHFLSFIMFICFLFVVHSSV